MQRRLSAKDIKDMLNEKALEVAQYLVPGGKVKGCEYRAGGLDGGKGESLQVYVQGERRGLWKEHNGGEDRYKDLLDLWSFSRSVSLAHAIKEAKDYLGIVEIKKDLQPKKIYQPPAPLPKMSLKPDTLRFLKEKRGFTDEIITKFGFKDAVNAESEKLEVYIPYFREGKHVRTKIREVHEKKFRVTAKSMDTLYGWKILESSELQDSSYVILVEGEFDAVALTQLGFNSLSLPMGVNNLNWIENDFQKLSCFDDIYICTDTDEAGQKAAKVVAQRLCKLKPKIMKLPYKDANEGLLKGMTADDVFSAMCEARFELPEKIAHASEEAFIKASLKAIHPGNEPTPGYGLGFDKTDSEIWFRPGELSIWSGINGHGKSTLLNQVVLNQLTKGAIACVASLEMPVVKLLPRLVRQCTGMHTPSPDYIRYILGWLKNKLWIYNHLGIQPVKELLETFEAMHTIYGCDVFVIDSLMLLDVDEESLTSQKEIVRQLTEFVQSRACHIHLVAHPRKLTTEFQKPNKMDVAGSGHIVNMTDNMFIVFRNKVKEIALVKRQRNAELTKLEQESLNQCDTYFNCTKQRYGEHENQYSFYYDVKSLRYRDYERQPIRPIVEYSRL